MKRIETARRRESDTDQVQSLVNRIAESPDYGATLTDLAQQVGLAASTAHRLLLTLERERYVRFSPDRRIWTIGVQAVVTECAFIKTRSPAALASPHLQRLMGNSGETVNLAVEAKDEVVYLAQVGCPSLRPRDDQERRRARADGRPDCQGAWRRSADFMAGP